MQQQYQGGGSKLDMWLISHSEYFKPEHMTVIQEQLRNVPEDRVNMLLSLQLKKPMTILLFSIFLGELGVDRFMLGDIGLGVGKLLTLGGCLVWWLIDLFLVMDRARTINFQMFMQAMNSSGHIVM
jgi:hypothetical protein